MNPHIFISYGKEPRTVEFVKWLHDVLEAEKFEAWLDERDIEGGADWDREIELALEGCYAMILIITRRGLSSDVVRAEWNYVLNAGKPIIPLIYEKDLTFADMPFRLQLKQGISCYEKQEDYQAWVLKFMRAIPVPRTRLEQLRLQLATFEKDRLASRDPARFDAKIKEVQEKITLEERATANPVQTQADATASIEAGIQRVQQQQIKAAEQQKNRSSERVVGRLPQNIKERFKDRHKERASLGKYLDDPVIRLAVVVGQGGIGKTAMACMVLDELEHAYENIAGLVYLSARTTGISLEKIFTSIGRMVGQEPEMIAVYNDAKTELTQRIDKLLAVVHQDVKRYILLLDNLETYQQDDGALTDPELAEFLHCVMVQQHALRVLVTTRVPLQIPPDGKPATRTIRLDEGLPVDDAVLLLRELDTDGAIGLRDLKEDAPLRDLAKRLYGYPRALEAAAGRLSDPYTTLPDLLAQADLFGGDVIANMVRSAINTLEPDALRVMQALAVYNRPMPEVAVEYLLEPFQEMQVTRAALRQLVKHQFASFDKAAGTYALHPVDRAYTYERISVEGDFSRKPLANRAGDYFARIRQPQNTWKSIKDLEPQLAEFEQRVAAEDYDAAARIMDDIDFDYLQLWGHWQRGLEMRQRLLDKLTNTRLGMANYGQIGNAFYLLGNAKVAIQHYEKGLQLAREANDQQSEGGWLGNLGLAYRDLGDVRQAIGYYEQALAIDREIGNRGGEGIRLGNLGNAYTDLGDVRQAIGYYEQALAIDREVGNRRSEGTHLGNLGLAYSHLGDVRKAITYYEQSLAIAQEIGDRLGEEANLASLGATHYNLGDIHTSINYLELSLSISQEIGNRKRELETLGNLAEVYRVENEIDKAVALQKQAIEIANEIDSPDSLSYFGGQLALTYLLNNALQDAYNVAQQVAQYDSPQDNHNVSAVLGVIATRQKNPPVAKAAFEKTIAQTDEMLNKEAQNYNALYAKALALTGLNRKTEAITTYKQARAIFDGAGIIWERVQLLKALMIAQPGLEDVLAALEGK